MFWWFSNILLSEWYTTDRQNQLLILASNMWSNNYDQQNKCNNQWIRFYCGTREWLHERKLAQDMQSADGNHRTFVGRELPAFHFPPFCLITSKKNNSISSARQESKHDSPSLCMNWYVNVNDSSSHIFQPIFRSGAGRAWEQGYWSSSRLYSWTLVVQCLFQQHYHDLLVWWNYASICWWHLTSSPNLHTCWPSLSARQCKQSLCLDW